MRVTRVYTKSGDAGETSLVDGSRVSKADPRVAAYGDVNELNSLLGIARVGLTDPQLNEALGRIQNELFIVGADLASPLEIKVPRIVEDHITEMERLIDLLLEELEPLREFILPGGTQLGATLHLARAVSRRAERSVVALAAPIGDQQTRPDLSQSPLRSPLRDGPRRQQTLRRERRAGGFQ